MLPITFDKDKTLIVKGFAILFMMILHCLANSEWYDVRFAMFDIPNFERIFSTFKICVGMFTFMVGYGYAFSKSKNLQYSWDHTTKLLTPFWIVLFVFTIPLCDNIDGENLLKNMFGVNSTLNYFSWFVYFYVYAMIVMPLLSRMIDRKWWLAIIVIGISFACEVAIHIFTDWENSDYLSALFNCFMQTPCMIFGYLFAKHRLFERVPLPDNKFLICAMSLLCAVMALVLRYAKSAVLGFSLSVVYAPMMIFAIVALFSCCKMRYTSIALKKLGELSVYMWFLHALFFTEVVRAFYQPLILISDNLFVVTLWTILLTTIMAFVLKSAVDGLQRLIYKR
jgi:surface polysaccharide O-acyltransferase-like enzyme